MGKPLNDHDLQDPLHEILERHLFRSSAEGDNSGDIVTAVVADYLFYLDSQGVHMPHNVKPLVIEDLREEIREIIVRRTYGTVKLESESSTRGAAVPIFHKKTVRKLT